MTSIPTLLLQAKKCYRAQFVLAAFSTNAGVLSLDTNPDDMDMDAAYKALREYVMTNEVAK